MNRWGEAAQIALVDIRLNPTRSVLSLSGIVIGIASVTIILAFGAGVRELVYEKFTAMGLAEYKVFASYDRKTQRVGELSLEDVALLQALPFVEAVFPETGLYDKTVRSAEGATKADIFSISSESAQATTIPLAQGRTLSSLDMKSRAQNCLLANTLMPELFPDGNALDKTIWVEEAPWKVVGVFSADKFSFMSFNSVKSVILPFHTLIRVYQDARLQSIVVRVKPEFKGDSVREIKEAISRGDPLRESLYQVADWKLFMEQRAKAVQTMTLVGALIAVISLLVGEIGVMNVMLTSVAERTREIGLRRALGARKRDILNQFVVESVVLNALGGLLGLLLGVLLAQLLPSLLTSLFQEELRVRILPSFVLFAVGSSSLLGGLFGLYPASKAARIPPAEALRAE